MTLESKQICLRGSNIANTNWVVGIVVFTGQETKIMLNQGNESGRHKQTQIEGLVNSVCIYLIAL